MERSSGGQSNSNGGETLLDVRDQDAPDNVLTVLKKASELSNGSTLDFLIGSNPFQLYDLLQQRGFFLEMIPQGDGSYRGKVKPRETTALSH